jgi:hypothetical protein
MLTLRVDAVRSRSNNVVCIVPAWTELSVFLLPARTGNFFLVAKNSHWLWGRHSVQWLSDWCSVGGPFARFELWKCSLTPICCRDLHTSIWREHGELYLSQHDISEDLECFIYIVVCSLTVWIYCCALYFVCRHFYDTQFELRS